jgi:hypothetical protein
MLIAAGIVAWAFLLVALSYVWSHFRERGGVPEYGEQTTLVDDATTVATDTPMAASGSAGFIDEPATRAPVRMVPHQRSPAA